MKRAMVLVLGGMVAVATWAQEPLYEAGHIFDPAAEDHGHVHASCIVECPNGDLLAVWYENGEPLPDPYYQGDRDKSDDVRIGGARKPHGEGAWNKPFVMADTFGCSDNNPCMVVDADQRLWLVYPTLIGVPKKSWGSALVRFKVSSDYDKPGPPVWDKEGVLVPKVAGFDKVLAGADASPAKLERAQARLKDPLTLRLGWMPRAHPLVRSDGTVIVPLSNENFGIAAMAMTNDGGATWTMSSPVPSRRITQPTLVEYPDVAMTAFFRNDWPGHRIRRSDSKDGGMTWSSLEITDLPHPGAGIEAIVLGNGHLVMIYNDKEESPRDRLAVSISTDRGETWQWTRHLENTPNGRFDYPSIVEGEDGTMHATYSYNLETIKHVRFNEVWVQAGDG